MDNFNKRIGILGIGHAVPSRPITNDEILSAYGIELRPSFIARHIGIETRHFLGDGQATSDIAAEAAAEALRRAGVRVDQVSRLIVATVTGDYPSPATACVVQAKLGGSGFPAHDVGAACSGFVYALDQAIRYALTGDRYVLVVGADSRSRTLDMEDKRTVFLYGDGAGAVVVGPLGGEAGLPTPDALGFIHSVLFADGRGAEAVYVPAGGSKEPVTLEALGQKRHKLRMPDGSVVARNALQGFADLPLRVVSEAGVELSDVDFFVFHQPNLFLVRAALAELGIPEAKTHVNFQKYGNTVAASVPLALSEAHAEGRIRTGDLVLLCAVGAGFTGGAVLLRWNL